MTDGRSKQHKRKTPLPSRRGARTGEVSAPRMGHGASRGNSAADFAAALLDDGNHRRTRRHAIGKVRPARRRRVETRLILLARMLDRYEEGLSVRREGRAAKFRAARNAEEVLGDSAASTIGVGRPDAIVHAVVREAI